MPLRHKKLLQQTWQILKTDKKLWFLGLLSFAFLGGSEFSLAYQLYKFSYEIADSISQNSFIEKYNLININPVAWVTVLAFIFVILLINIFQASLIDLVSKRTDGKKATIKKSLKTSVKNLPRFFGINVLFQVVIYSFILLFVFLSKIIFVEVGDQISFIIISIVSVALPLVIILSFARRYALFYLVENYQRNIFKCYLLGLKLFIKKWFESVKTSVINFVFMVISSVLISAFIALLVWPTLYVVKNIRLSSAVVFDVGAISILAYTIIVSLFFAAIYGVFYYIYWIGVFKKIEK